MNSKSRSCDDFKNFLREGWSITHEASQSEAENRLDSLRKSPDVYLGARIIYSRNQYGVAYLTSKNLGINLNI